MNLGTTIKVAGGLLPPQLLERIAAGDSTLVGTAAADFHEENTVALNQAINRAWSVLTARWATFRTQLAQLPETDRATVLTRDKWLLPLFQELGYGRLAPERAAIVADDRPFAISHRWGHLPIHLVGARLSLDKRVPGERGAAASPPHGLVQDLLNHADGHLWAMLSNGMELRLLRDHRSLTRQAYVAFDLEAMFDGEQFSAFRLLYLLCHQSRVEGDDPRLCWLERWVQHAQDDGVRALDRLRGGVEAALTALGRGFIRHRANDALKARLGSGALSTQDYYRQLLKLVYRLIFLFVAEDRDLLLVPDAPEAAKDRFRRLYATRRLRTLAIRRRGGPHEDGWQALVLVMRQLDKGNANLALPALGSFLWSADEVGGKRVSRAIPDLDAASLANEDLYAALAALCVVQDGPVRRPVDWAGVQSDELGSVYEALMERVPRVNLAAGSFELASAAGNERKTTGSYYTPSSLVDCLLDSALDPVLEQAARSVDPEKAILDLSVVDPACGSGHFLVAAARRIAHRLARVRCGGIEPSPPEVQHALRDVVGHCIYGVDLNPMAVELCKVSLWMEAIEPGRPLSFLDGHVRHGNALLGTTPELVEKGIPDEAWEAIEGDDKDVAKRLKKENRNWQQTGLFGATAAWDTAALAKRAAEVDAADDTTADAVEQKEQAWRKLDDETAGARLLADLWCAAFVWPKQPGETERAAPVRGVWESVKQTATKVPDATGRITKDLAKQYAFFHWHLAFPRVFARGDEAPGGFDVVLGNPPWERIQPELIAFMAKEGWSSQEVARHERLRQVDGLKESDPQLYARWCDHRRSLLGTTHFLKSSERFPLSTTKNVNSYAVFFELSCALTAPRGRTGLLLQSGICTDDANRDQFGRLVATRRLVSVFDFENRESLFPAVDSRFRFSIVVAGGTSTRMDSPSFAFGLLRVGQLQDEDRVLNISQADLDLFAPNTGLCPMIPNRRELELLRRIYRSAGCFIRQSGAAANPWRAQIRRIFSTGYDGDIFQVLSPSEATDGRLPVYEGRMVHQYDHHFGVGAGSERRADMESEASTRVAAGEVRRRFSRYGWNRAYYIAFRDIARATDERTCISCVCPDSAPTDTLRVVLVGTSTCAPLLATLNSFVVDFAARRIMGGGTHLAEFIAQQLPIPKPHDFDLSAAWGLESSATWILPRVLELTYTAWNLEPFANDVGYSGPPFRWDSARRFLLRCELDAAFFHLYGLSRDDTAYILDTFPIVRKNDEKAHGEYRTKRVILEVYDAMAEAIRTGEPYQTRLDPPPADPRVAHPPRQAAVLADQWPELLGIRPVLPVEHEWLVLVVALVHAAGGSITQRDLSRAFVLIGRPDLVFKFAFDETRTRAEFWAARHEGHPAPPGALTRALNLLADRDALRLETTPGREVFIAATDHTPAEGLIDAWFRFEARLALQVVRTMDLSAVEELAAAAPAEDRRLLAGGAA